MRFSFMNDIDFKLVRPVHTETIQQIADWYLAEWHIPTEKTIQNISTMPESGTPFQMIMTLNGEMIATAGIYHTVALTERIPRFAVYSPWLALVYTVPELRGNGYGAILCQKVNEYAKEMGLKELYLFTHTAESLYKRLGWQLMERLDKAERNIAVMKFEL